MTVKELIEKLQEFDENKEVLYWDPNLRETRTPKVEQSYIFENEVHVF